MYMRRNPTKKLKNAEAEEAQKDASNAEIQLMNTSFTDLKSLYSN